MLFAVVFPAEDGGICEEDDADGNDVAADRSDIVGEGCHGEGHAGQGLAVSAKAPRTPEEAMVRPVMEQTTMVSMKVPVMEM